MVRTLLYALTALAFTVSTGCSVEHGPTAPTPSVPPGGPGGGSSWSTVGEMYMATAQAPNTPTQVVAAGVHVNVNLPVRIYVQTCREVQFWITFPNGRVKEVEPYQDCRGPSSSGITTYGAGVDASMAGWFAVTAEFSEQSGGEMRPDAPVVRVAGFTAR